MSSLLIPEGTVVDPDKTFTLLERIGKGSYGVVWSAIHNTTGKRVAIKQIDMHDAAEGIDKEIQIMRQCNESDRVVHFYGSCVHNDVLWIILEMCAAGSISDIMRINERCLTENQISVVLKQVLQALVYLHGMNKIHRDVKAGNILLTPEGDCKLADFGVSTETTTKKKRFTVIGTPYWMAPEVIAAIGHGVKADIWSVGITAIELAEGAPPHADVHPMRESVIISAIFLIPQLDPPTVSEPSIWSDNFKDFLARCCKKDPEQRPSAEELLKHPFIAGNGKTKQILSKMIDTALQHYSKNGHDLVCVDVFEHHVQSEDEAEDEPYDTTAQPTAVGGTKVFATKDGTCVVKEKKKTHKTPERTPDDGPVLSIAIEDKRQSTNSELSAVSSQDDRSDRSGDSWQQKLARLNDKVIMLQKENADQAALIQKLKDDNAALVDQLKSAQTGYSTLATPQKHQPVQSELNDKINVMNEELQQARNKYITVSVIARRLGLSPTKLPNKPNLVGDLCEKAAEDNVGFVGIENWMEKQLQKIAIQGDDDDS